MTPAQFEALPDCFQQIIRIDRAFRAPVVPIALAKERRVHRRFAQLMVQQPKSGGGNAGAMR